MDEIRKKKIVTYQQKSQSQDKIDPTFRRLNNSSEIVFMQDGAPTHWVKSVRDWMNVHLPDRWIGRGLMTSIFPGPPDLTPMNYFLWGYSKSKVYT